jgi:hypothetical protein
MDADAVHHQMLELKGEYQLLNQRLDSSISAMTSHLSALQGDMQAVRGKLDALSHAQTEFRDHSSGLDRVNKALEKFIEASERRWAAHEGENRIVADLVNSHRTGIKISWGVFGFFVLVLGALGNTQIRRVDERMADHLRAGEDTKRAIEARFQRNEADIRQQQTDLRQVRTP